MADPLTAAHIEGERRLRVAVRAAIDTAWRGLPGYDRGDVDTWLSQALPLVAAGKRQSVLLTEAYLARVLKRQPLGLDPDRVAKAIRKGARPEEVYRRPFVRLWKGLSDGTPFEVANGAALAQAAGSAALDIQLAARETFAAVQGADEGIYGFQRVADGGACEFCLAIDGAYVKSADAMALHNNCGCSLEPLTSPHPRAAKLPSGVAVHEHGEIGPMLGSPDHSFTTEAEALG